jgi:hypothetical protein
LNKPARSKLFKLKEWLTLPEAAKHLSSVCDEEVTEADILRLGLDGHLKLSVYFKNQVYVISGYLEKTALFEIDSDNAKTEVCLKAIEEINKHLSEYTFVENKKARVFPIMRGVFELPMIGGEWRSVESKWRYLTDGPEQEHKHLEEVIVEKDDGGVYALKEILDEEDFLLNGMKPPLDDRSDFEKFMMEPPRNSEYFYPAGGLPIDTVYVVRTEALREFEQLISDNEAKNAQTKPHGNTEINAQKREQIIGAALTVITKWPEQCRNGLGKFEATKIAEVIDQKAYLFWHETGNPPLARQKMEREISKWINGTVK